MPDYKSRQERKRASNKSKKKPQNKGRKIFKRVFLSLAVLILLIGISGVVAVAAIIQSAPQIKATDLKTPISTKIYFKDGSLMTSVGAEDRTYAPINKIPDIVKEAFISTEDTRFYSHFGIDPYRIGGAILANFKNGFGAQGGSTITQQVVKNDILSNQKTITRKVQEAYLAIRLEQLYSKDQILEMYLNTIFLGDRSYGVATAAYNYFGLTVDQLSQLTLAQAAMLAALPKAPSYYDPMSNPTAAKERRDLVLDLMVKNKVISQAQADEAKKVTISDMLKNGNKNQNQGDYDSVLNLIETQYVGDGKPISKEEFYQGGLKIYTTIDKHVQDTIENVLNDDRNFASAKPNLQAGIATINTQTGAILGIGGGRHYNNGTNWALSGDTFKGTGHQVGSTAKPLVDYGPAIEYLKWPTSHMIKDEPYTYSGTKIPVGEWDGKYWGDLSIERALIWSRNVPAVKTLNELDTTLGKKKVIDYEKKLGITFNPSKYVESYAIGSFTANPLEIAGAYATYGNMGVYNAPHAIYSISYPDGREVKLDHDEHVAFHDYTAYMVTDMLKGVTQTPTTYSGPSLAGYPIVGKSGSTNVSDDLAKMYHLTNYSIQHGNVDEWFTGYSPKVTTSVWTGYVKPDPSNKDDGVVLTGSSTHIASTLFGKVMKGVTSKKTAYWKQPNSVVRASVEKSTGLLASDSTPKDDTMTGLFVKGTEPQEVSTKYQKLNPVTNLKALYNPLDNTVLLSWNYGDPTNMTFEVDQNTDSGLQPIGTTDQLSFTVNNVQLGTDYEFGVTAIYTDPNDAANNRKSDPVKVKITIPSVLTPGGTSGTGTGTDTSGGTGGSTNGTGGTSGSTDGSSTNPAQSPANSGTNSTSNSANTSSLDPSSVINNPIGLDTPSQKQKKKQ